MTTPATIDLSAAGLTADGRALGTLDDLVAVFGEPRSRSERVVEWGHAGLTVWVVEDGAVESISIDLADDPRWNQRIGKADAPATPVFPGAITVEGRPVLDAATEDELMAMSSSLEIERGDFTITFWVVEDLSEFFEEMETRDVIEYLGSGAHVETIRGAQTPFREVTMFVQTPEPIREPSGRWDIAPIDEPVLELSSFALKLAVIEAVMYDEELLTPRFDVFDFAADRGADSFDPHEVYDEMIPAVREWFEQLPIPARLGASVTELEFLGSEVYLQLLPNWDGEDDLFTVYEITDADLAQLPNLTTVDDEGSFIGPKAWATLRAHGIEVSELSDMFDE